MAMIDREPAERFISEELTGSTDIATKREPGCDTSHGRNFGARLKKDKEEAYATLPGQRYVQIS